MAKFIDERRVRFYDGEKYVFEYLGDNEWACTSHDMVPSEIVSEIEQEW